MASSWKLKTTLRRKKSLGSMPSPAFARAGPPPSRGQALEPVDRLAVALAVGVVHGREHVGRPRQLELHDGHPEAGMTLEDAGEDQITQRQCRIERLGRTAAGVARCLVAGPADPALPSRRGVQLNGRSSAAAAAQNGSYSDRTYDPPLRNHYDSQFPNGIVSSVSLVSTTNTARSLAGFVLLALALTPWRSPGNSEKLCPAL
jgi:hypothetical protein